MNDTMFITTADHGKGGGGGGGGLIRRLKSIFTDWNTWERIRKHKPV